jgi:GntR family transcriptional regulator, transcriptional repressor for pyruvate dehydrogenase complex
MKKPLFRKLAPVRIFEQVVNQIRDMILNGVFHPGDKLPSEQELEKQFNVSRSSIREALRVLEYDGFVEVRRGSGTFIADYAERRNGRIEVARWLEKREDTLQEVLQVREYLEGLNASLAASKADKEKIASIGSIQEEYSALVKSEKADDDIDINELVRLDLKFHMSISEAGSNSLVHELVSNVVPAFQDSNKAVLYVGASSEKTMLEHKKILDAIESGDPAAAELAMRDHISRVRIELLNISSTLQEESDTKNDFSLGNFKTNK